MKRYLAALLSVLLLMTSTPLVSADIIYNDDVLNWGEYSCPHSQTEEVAAVASTCTTHGYTAHVRCADCKMVVAGVCQERPLADHTYTLTENLVPTCTENGKKVYTCSVCGDSYTEVIGALGHSYDDDADATCNRCGDMRVVLGDVNGNGKVDNRDVGLLQQYVNEYDVTVHEHAADLDGNGRINNRDLGLLLRLVNEK